MTDMKDGYVVTNGDGSQFRAWGDHGPVWTPHLDGALWFARRVDAERFAAEDEAAWSVVLASVLKESREIEARRAAQHRAILLLYQLITDQRLWTDHGVAPTEIHIVPTSSRELIATVTFARCKMDRRFDSDILLAPLDRPVDYRQQIDLVDDLVESLFERVRDNAAKDC